MATPDEMAYYKAFYVGPDFNLKDTICMPLFRDLVTCQEEAAFPLRDCILYKEDFLECVLRQKQTLKFQMMQNEKAKVDAKEALAYIAQRTPISFERQDNAGDS